MLWDFFLNFLIFRTLPSAISQLGVRDLLCVLTTICRVSLAVHCMPASGWICIDLHSVPFKIRIIHACVIELLELLSRPVCFNASNADDVRNPSVCDNVLTEAWDLSSVMLATRPQVAAAAAVAAVASVDDICDEVVTHTDLHTY